MSYNITKKTEKNTRIHSVIVRISLNETGFSPIVKYFKPFSFIFNT